MNQQAVLSTSNAEPVARLVHNELSQKTEPTTRAVIKKKVTVNTLQGQKVMKRSFEAVKRSFFSVAVILRIIHRDEEQKIQVASDFLNNQFEEIETEIEKEIDRIQKILDDNGVEEKAAFTHPIDWEVEVDTPYAARFLKLVAKLELLIQQIETAWITGELDDGQRKNATHKWQQRLNKFASRFIATEAALRKRAKKSSQGDEVEQEAPASVEPMDDELAADVRAEQSAIEAELKNKAV